MEFKLIFNSTPLMFAAFNGHTEIARLLLIHGGIDINIKNI